MVGVENVWIYVIIGVVILAGAIAYGVNLTRGRGDTRTLDREAPTGPRLPGEDLDRRPPGSTDTLAPPEAPTAPRWRPRGRRPLPRRRHRQSSSSSGPSRPADASPACAPDSPAPTAPSARVCSPCSSRGKLDEEAWEEVEDTLIASDLGVEATTELVESLRLRVKVDGTTDEATVREWLREDLLGLVQPDMDRRIASSRVDDRPAVVLVVGVNGTGKTTTVGKLARVLVAEDREVLLGAADTFRAAAADQLETWGARVGVATVRSDKDGADPAAVAFDAVKAGIEEEVDVVIIDTAGRLHNKVDLMDELGKVKRVIEKQSPIDEVLLVLDATTGQNGLRAGQGLRRGRRRHRHRADQARRHRQGRHRRRGAAPARRAGQARRPR